MALHAESAYRFLTPEVRARIEALRPRYPDRRALLMPALWAIQEAHGWIPLEAQAELAAYLEVPSVWVHEVVSFYNMYRERPVGRYLIYVCGNIACSLRGARRLLRFLLDRLGVAERTVTPDGLFTVERVQCIGACELAPVIQVNGEFIGPVDEARLEDLITALRAKAREVAS
jgi:NADH-quinone oxidoreductase subunit E